MEWQLQDAKNQFSKVVQRARTEGRLIVTLRGQRAAMVLSTQDYDALTANRHIVEHCYGTGMGQRTRSNHRLARQNSQWRCGLLIYLVNYKSSRRLEADRMKL